MVRAIITWSLHNRLIVILATVLLIIAGIHSARNLNVEAYPDPTPPWSRSSPRTPAPIPRKWSAWSESRSKSP